MKWIVWGAFNGAMAVALSALSNHLPLAVGAQEKWVQWALEMHRFHALGLIALGLIAHARAHDLVARRGVHAAGVLMSAGLILFCLNLYARAWWGLDTFKAAVPWGGMAFILGWAGLAAVLVKKDPTHAGLKSPTQ